MTTSSFLNQQLSLLSSTQTLVLEAKGGPQVEGLEDWKHLSFSLVLHVLYPNSQLQRKSEMSEIREGSFPATPQGFSSKGDLICDNKDVVQQSCISWNVTKTRIISLCVPTRVRNPDSTLLSLLHTPIS